MNPFLEKIRETLAETPLGTAPKKVLVALSGGADSVVLAHALRALGHTVMAAHLNHGLRGAESDGDENFVVALCEKWGIPLIHEKVDMKRFAQGAGNLENAGRRERYAFFERARAECGAELIATGHHLDDQIETILMHMARGAGLRGQCGMANFGETHEGSPIVRPLLKLTRAEIEAYAHEHQLPHHTDSSNHDLSFDRNYWRTMVIPYLKKARPRLNEEIQEMSQRAREELARLGALAEKWMTEHMNDARFRQGEFTALKPELQAEILIRLLGAEDLYNRSLEQFRAFINMGHSGRRMMTKKHFIILEHGWARIEMTQDKTPILSRMRLERKEQNWGTWLIRSDSESPLYARPWKDGDRFRPSGMSGRKKLQDFFTDEKIPRRLRDQIPIITDENDVIMAVGNLRLASGAQHLERELFIEKNT